MLMMVLFISQSIKKAQLVTRRILDQYADRIGNDVWRTVITSDGLETVKVLLKKNASRNTAVACHWIRSRNRDDLLWIVGRRDVFDENGRVPVNFTTKEMIHEDWENDWAYLPFVTILTALAALFHDWGKASDYFQDKLARELLTADPFRHEWISCKILEAVVRCSHAWDDDKKWLAFLAEGKFDQDKVGKAMTEGDLEKLAPLPPLAGLLTWLIFSHHRLPDPDKTARNKYDGRQRKTLAICCKASAEHGDMKIKRPMSRRLWRSVWPFRQDFFGMMRRYGEKWSKNGVTGHWKAMTGWQA